MCLVPISNVDGVEGLQTWTKTTTAMRKTYMDQTGTGMSTVNTPELTGPSVACSSEMSAKKGVSRVKSRKKKVPLCFRHSLG